jgi:hypothetical protein
VASLSAGRNDLANANENENERQRDGSRQDEWIDPAEEEKDRAEKIKRRKREPEDNHLEPIHDVSGSARALLLLFCPLVVKLQLPEPFCRRALRREFPEGKQPEEGEDDYQLESLPELLQHHEKLTTDISGRFGEPGASFLLRDLFGYMIGTRCAAPNYELTQPFPSTTGR